MLKIDIHTHIIPKNLNEITNSFNDSRFLKINEMTDNNARLEINNELFRKVSCNCWNINKRIEECKESKVDIQVLSIIPVLFSYWSKPKDCENLCKFINNSFNEIVINYPKKFIVLGTIPMQDTELAIKEMDRCINELNFPGIQIGTNVNGENLYEDRFLPIFKHAERIGCSIFTDICSTHHFPRMNKY